MARGAAAGQRLGEAEGGSRRQGREVWVSEAADSRSKMQSLGQEAASVDGGLQWLGG